MRGGLRIGGIRITAGVAAAVITAAGCGQAVAARPQPTAVSRGVAASDLAATPRALGAADTAFGLDVLGAWCRQDPPRTSCCPRKASRPGSAWRIWARGAAPRGRCARCCTCRPSAPRLDAGLHARSAALRGLDGPGVTVAGSDRVWTNPGDGAAAQLHPRRGRRVRRDGRAGPAARPIPPRRPGRSTPRSPRPRGVTSRSCSGRTA